MSTNAQNTTALRGKKLRGVVYDLDGTAIDTAPLHEKAWIEAARMLGIVITRDFLLFQRGVPEDEAARVVVNSHSLAARFATTKKATVAGMMQNIPIHDGFFETVDGLRTMGLQVWICTSATQAFVETLFSAEPRFASIAQHTIYREMYKKGKPDPEPLLLAAKKMGLSITKSLYVGDAAADFAASMNAGCSFVYFMDGFRDERLPPDVLTITKHLELLDMLK